MSDIEEIGNVEKKKEAMEIEWEITDFFSIAAQEKEFKSASFSFANTSWHFRQRPQSKMESGFLYLYLVQTGNLKSSVEYDFGLKKLDGCIEYPVKGIINCYVNTTPWLKNERHSDAMYLNWAEMQQRQSELAPSGVLIITCTLKYETIRFGREKMAPPKLKKFISK